MALPRPKILMVAYACNPEAHGEHLLGWGWAVQAAQLGEVHLLTPTWARAAVERHAAAHGIRAYFPEIAPMLLRLTAPLGNNGLWLREFLWQPVVARLAAQLHARERFDVVHQTTFHTFRVPFRAASLGVPAVWGPIAGGESVPRGFSDYLGSAASGERVRPILNRLCLWEPAVQRSLQDARALLVSNRTTLDFLPAWCRAKSRIVPPNAVADDLPPALPPSPPRGNRPLSLLYLGNCVPTRSIPLVLAAMRRAGELPLQLTIAGDGPALAEWRRAVLRLGLAARVHFAGRVPREALPALYAQTDALVFPGLRESGGSALLEAMSLGVPVICFDWGGPGEIVTAQNGIKISVASPESAIGGLAEAFARLARAPDWARALGARAAEDVREQFTWEKKRRLLAEVYEAVQSR
jgi:glycosyltransferase involved in cell wall biosynthesis